MLIAVSLLAVAVLAYAFHVQRVQRIRTEALRRAQGPRGGSDHHLMH